MKKAITIILAALAFGISAMAQSEIRGKVTDINGEPLPGAGVTIKGTNTGTATDINGEFVLRASEGTRLSVEFLGFRTHEFTVGKATEYSITLEEDENMLEDVVVVGYDVQKKVNLTGSVSSVSTKALNNRPIVQGTAALQGMAAGVTVTTQSGEPGSDGGTIRVRGIGTFGGSSAAPLVLIDGVEGSLDALDVTQIDQITVLKDAASSAIYGNRAANGVILVTTKRAEKGVTTISYRGYVGWQKPTDVTKTVSPEEFMTLRREADANDGKTSIYTQDYIDNYRANNAIDPDRYPITDWKKEILTGSGFTHNHSLTLSASSDKIRTLTALSYMDQKGIIKGTDYFRIGVRNNMDVELSKKLHMKFDLSLTWGHKNTNPGQSALFTQLSVSDPVNHTRWITGGYPMLTGGSVNSLAYLDDQGGNNKSNTYRLTGSLSLTYDPVDWLTIEAQVAPRYVMTESHVFKDKITFWVDAFGTPATASNVAYNSLVESCNRSFYGNYYGKVIFHKNFKRQHNLRVLLGASYEDFDQKTLSATRTNYAYPQYDVISAGANDETKDNAGRRYQYAYGSFYARASYNYRERYLVEANFRYDGSSRFNAANRWAPFYSASLAWRMTEEKWMANVKNILTELKIRASWGTLGNQNIGSSYYPTEQTLAMGNFSVNDMLVPIATLNTLANPNLTWETTQMWDAGVDFALWNKVSVTADWYHKTTNGILMQLDIPASIGRSKPYQNAGVVTNMGWEISAGYHDSFGDFRVGVDANVSDVKNKIVDMKGTSSGGSDGVIRNAEGTEINSIYGLVCLGMVRSQEDADYINAKLPQYNTRLKPGDLYYADINEDGKVNDNDKKIIGGTIPHYTYGLTLSFGWKGLDFSMFFQGVGKVNGYLSGYYVMPCYQGGTFRKEHLDRFNADNPNGKYPRLTYTSGDINQKPSTFWMADASYCRLKNIQLSYTLPANLTKKAKINTVKFFANGQNVFTITKFYQGYDPEVAYSSQGDDGVKLGSASNYPQVRTFTFGVELRF